jgi:hypothetical protein
VRAAWRAEVSERLEASRFVFVDEMGTNISLSPLYGWSRVGKRLCARAPKNWGKNITLLSSMTHRGMGPSVAVEGATTGMVFEAYVEQALVPSLSPGQVVVMDNLSAHKGARVRGLVEGAGCELLYLPPYSPDLNPIEEAFRGGEGDLEEGPSPNPRNAHRNHGPGAGGGGPFGRPRLLRTPRLPRCHGSTVLTNALGSL